MTGRQSFSLFIIHWMSRTNKFLIRNFHLLFFQVDVVVQPPRRQLLVVGPGPGGWSQMYKGERLVLNILKPKKLIIYILAITIFLWHPTLYLLLTLTLYLTLNLIKSSTINLKLLWNSIYGDTLTFISLLLFQHKR